MWIGGTDQEEEGDWKWTDCNPWNFTKWHPGEPNNDKKDNPDGDNCAVISSIKTGYDWLDAPCTPTPHWGERHFVCTRLMCAGKMFELLYLKATTFKILVYQFNQ